MESVLENGHRTKDIMSKEMKEVGCIEMGNLAAQELEKKIC